ncbi:MAG: hypothetical protein VB021_08130 [Oscillospiraceae bacterium]|nr:hypothetical protein [Oscillospiraceae bacterium]
MTVTEHFLSKFVFKPQCISEKLELLHFGKFSEMSHAIFTEYTVAAVELLVYLVKREIINARHCAIPFKLRLDFLLLPVVELGDIDGRLYAAPFAV